MKQFKTVFWYELKSMVLSKAYIITTVLTILFILGGTLAPNLISKLSGNGSKKEVTTVGLYTSNIAVTNSLKQTESDLIKFKSYDSYDLLKKDVKEGKISTGIVTDNFVKVEYIVKEIGLNDNLEAYNKLLSSSFQQAYLESKGISKQDIQIIQSPVNYQVTRVGDGKNQIVAFGYTYAMIMIIYMAIITIGSKVSSSVALEKTNRTMEMMIVSVKPNSIIFGKILSVGVAVLIQMAIWLGLGVLMSNNSFSKNITTTYIHNIPLDIIAYAFIFFILAFFFYAFLFGAAGSLVSKLEDLGYVIQPITLIFIAAFIAVITQLSNVNGQFFKVISFIPFTSPMAMFARIAMGQVSQLSIIISILILLVTDIIIGFLAAKIYHLGLLMYGQPPKIKTIIKLLFSK